eukprot:TRINITY_DN350_c0_g1_i3.p1 TRINITY_DN350_c0_g1~~TRINITY_DN350_c0_g1_i3.p1  ORF type:complete len:284 (-),score=79.30 TRINITY_DN350_c0_g1_i3:15-866(-)
MGDQRKLTTLGNSTYKEQAVWFLNAYWRQFGQQEAEKVWTYAHRYASLDSNGIAGHSLDEFGAHRFLELNNETLTVVAMREHWRKTGIEHVKLVPLIHFLIFRYQVDWHQCVNAAQGDNAEEVAKAQRMLEEAQAAVKEAERRDTEAKAAQRELEAALAELKAQEDAFNNKTADLTKRSNEGGGVSRNKAKAELAQHLAEDPLPLRRAKINQEAAVRKAERASKAAEDALNVAVRSLDAAQEYLNEVSSRPGSAAGALWWIDRELHEARAYLPTARGGYKKAK